MFRTSGRSEQTMVSLSGCVISSGLTRTYVGCILGWFPCGETTVYFCQRQTEKKITFSTAYEGVEMIGGCCVKKKTPSNPEEKMWQCAFSACTHSSFYPHTSKAETMLRDAVTWTLSFDFQPVSEVTKITHCT